MVAHTWNSSTQEVCVWGESDIKVVLSYTVNLSSLHFYNKKASLATTAS